MLGVLDKKANKVNMFVAAAGMNWKREEKFKNVKWESSIASVVTCLLLLPFSSFPAVCEINVCLLGMYWGL